MSEQKYASILQRGLAFFIDYILIVTILALVANVLFSLLGIDPSLEDPTQMFNEFYVIAGSFLVIFVLYFSVFDSNRCKFDSPGKMALKIRTVTEQGDLSFSKSIARAALKFVSLLMLGYLLIFVTKKRQMLHDIVLGTVVLKK